MNIVMIPLKKGTQEIEHMYYQNNRIQKSIWVL